MPATIRTLLRALLVACLATPALPGCGTPPEAISPEFELPRTTFSFDRDRPSYEVFAEYRIKAGDVLEVLLHTDPSKVAADFRLQVDYQLSVKFPDAPALNETQTIRPDGTISLPYLGVVTVAGKTVQQLTDELRAAYAELVRKSREKDYRIRVGQQVAVKFVKLPELTEVQVVRPDGAISVPYLGVVPAAGKTVEELTQELGKRYRGILESPELYVVVSGRDGREEPPDYLGEGKVTELYVAVSDFRPAIDPRRPEAPGAPRGLARLITVRPDGHATFARVGDVLVAGKTIPEVDAILDEKHGALMAGLSVDVFLERHAAAQVYVLGAVGKPGAYDIARPSPVEGALALAGGPTAESDLESVMVVRRHEQKMVGVRIDLERLLDAENGAFLFYLMPDDIVYVPRRGLSDAALICREISDVIFFRGWSVSFIPYRFEPN